MQKYYIPGSEKINFSKLVKMSDSPYLNETYKVVYDTLNAHLILVQNDLPNLAD
jgi:hypothetical protein